MNIQNNIEQLCREFPDLKVKSISEKTITILGSLEINHIVRDEYIQNIYTIEVDIPTNYPDELPMVKETSCKVDKKYAHKYSNSSLCLATEVDMHVQLSPSYNLTDYVAKFVIPYFVSYEYYRKYKIYPFGERSHNFQGIVEFYEDVFETKDFESVYLLLEYTATNQYRGHTRCPCGSKVRLRKCHGKKIQTLQKEGILKHVQKEFRNLNTILQAVFREEKRQLIEKHL